jgi:hypothetical protein
MRKNLALVALAAALPALAFAQTSSPDTLSVLLNEVRLLRIALERSATTAPQIQLLGSRLTVQNDRVSRVSRDLDAARNALAHAIEERTMMTARAQELESALARQTDDEMRKQAGDQLRAVRQQVEITTAQEQRLRLQESELLNDLTVEQNQWTDLNRRLDELERTLAQPRR